MCRCCSIPAFTKAILINLYTYYSILWKHVNHLFICCFTLLPDYFNISKISQSITANLMHFKSTPWLDIWWLSQTSENTSQAVLLQQKSAVTIVSGLSTISRIVFMIYICLSIYELYFYCHNTFHFWYSFEISFTCVCLMRIRVN